MWQLDPKAGTTPLRETQLCSLHHPPGKAALPLYAKTLSKTQTMPPDRVIDSRRGFNRTKVVATESAHPVLDPRTTSSDILPGHRCLRPGTGNPNKRFQSHRPVGEFSDVMALQLKGNVRCYRCHKNEIQDTQTYNSITAD
ncbi:hypothetical protein JYU34_007181 [Plutella xylostella]|uniref:Uncharacterized protein n=1 Tax=Plutella xylostella TaxID=51655 RepID=A0ABQ7QPS2_PLUXY|nr:hypothetical protein JYU34_007181 [Plutella xylostella]